MGHMADKWASQGSALEFAEPQLTAIFKPVVHALVKDSKTSRSLALYKSTIRKIGASSHALLALFENLTLVMDKLNKLDIKNLEELAAWMAKYVAEKEFRRNCFSNVIMLNAATFNSLIIEVCYMITLSNIVSGLKSTLDDLPLSPLHYLGDKPVEIDATMSAGHTIKLLQTQPQSQGEFLLQVRASLAVGVAARRVCRRLRETPRLVLPHAEGGAANNDSAPLYSSDGSSRGRYNL